MYVWVSQFQIPLDEQPVYVSIVNVDQPALVLSLLSSLVMLYVMLGRNEGAGK